MNLDKLYKINSQPLELVEEVVIGESYCTDEGVTIEFVDENNVNIVRSSPLNDGEFITELNSKLLNLFWKLRSKGAVDR
jgi:hypothetical protein